MALLVLLATRDASEEKRTAPIRERAVTLEAKPALDAPRVDATTTLSPSKTAPEDADRCGLPEPAPKEAGGAADLEAAIEAADASWGPRRAALLERLSTSADLRARGAADYLRAAQGLVQAGLVASLCDSPPAARGLASPRACERMRARSGAAGPALDRLVAMALSARDPVVYGWAVAACGRETPPVGPCHMVSAEEWARLAPEDAVVWQHVARAAAERRDTQATDAAMHRMAQATRFDGGLGQLARVMVDSLPAATVHEKANLAVEAVGVEAALEAALNTAVFWCKPPLDANRRQVCDSLATGFVERGRSLTHHMLGSAIARYTGWSSEQLGTLAQQQEAYLGALMEEQPSSTSSCDGQRAILRHVTGIAAEGELAMARRRLAASGLSLAEAAEAWRRRSAAWTAAMAAATAASGSASTPADPPRQGP